MLRLLVLGLALQSGFAVAEPGPPVVPTAQTEARREDVRKLLILMGVDKMTVQMIKGMLDAQRAANPAIPAGTFDWLLTQVDPNEMVEIAIPAYQHHLSAADVQTAIAFYSSDGGQRLIAAQPAILAENFAASQGWAEGLQAKVAKHLQDEAAALGQPAAPQPAAGAK